MCNCNQKRVEYSSEKSPLQKGMVKVMLTENAPRVLNGDFTGRMYVFRNQNDFNWVDKRDAIGMKHMQGVQVMT